MGDVEREGGARWTTLLAAVLLWSWARINAPRLSLRAFQISSSFLHGGKDTIKERLLRDERLRASYWHRPYYFPSVSATMPPPNWAFSPPFFVTRLRSLFLAMIEGFHAREIDARNIAFDNGGTQCVYWIILLLRVW